MRKSTDLAQSFAAKLHRVASSDVGDKFNLEFFFKPFFIILHSGCRI